MENSALVLRPVDCLLILMGSGVGGLARYVLGQWLTVRYPSSLPWGTMAANVTGCLLLGMLMGWIGPKPGLGPWRLLLGVGFLGGYTTFSTLLYDTWRLGGRWGALNLLLNVVLGYLATAAGARIGRLF